MNVESFCKLLKIIFSLVESNNFSHLFVWNIHTFFRVRKNSFKRSYIFEVKIEKLNLSSVHIDWIFSIESISISVFRKVSSSCYMSEETIIWVFPFIGKSLYVNHEKICIMNLEGLTTFINNNNVCFVFEVDFMLKLNVKTCIWR